MLKKGPLYFFYTYKGVENIKMAGKSLYHTQIAKLLQIPRNVDKFLRQLYIYNLPKLYEYEVITVIRGVCHRKIGDILPPLKIYTLEKL